MNVNQKKKLIVKIKEDLRSTARDAVPPKELIVGQKKDDIIEVMSQHHANNGLYSQKAVDENLNFIRKELLPENLQTQEKKAETYRCQREYMSNLSNNSKGKANMHVQNLCGTRSMSIPFAPTQAGLYYSPALDHHRVSQRSLNSVSEHFFDRSAYQYDIKKFEKSMNHLNQMLQKEREEENTTGLDAKNYYSYDSR